MFLTCCINVHACIIDLYYCLQSSEIKLLGFTNKYTHFAPSVIFLGAFTLEFSYTIIILLLLYACFFSSFVLWLVVHLHGWWE